MIKLAENYGQGNLALSQISRDEKISLAYLERLFAGLKKANLVKAEKGVSGGYKLTHKPKDTPVFEIVKTLEGKMSPFHCLDDKGKIYCTDKCRCGVTGVLIKVQAAVNETLKKMTLRDLI